jgi:hypothetical protein
MADGRVSPPKLRAPPPALIIEDQMLIDNLVDDIVSELGYATSGMVPTQVQPLWGTPGFQRPVAIVPPSVGNGRSGGHIRGQTSN